MTTRVDASLEEQIVELTSGARAASRQLANQDTETKNGLLLELAEMLGSEAIRSRLLKANDKDVAAAREKGISGALLDRLAVDDKRIGGMIQGLEEVARLPDPVGVVRKSWTRPNGLQVDKRTIPLAARGRSTFSELRWYPPMEAAKGSLSWVFRAKQPESVRTGP